MNTFIKDTETGEIYYFDLYEKWWYCFFLCFAMFLPHQVSRVRDLCEFDKFKENLLDEGVKRWWIIPLAMGGGQLIVSLLSMMRVSSFERDILGSNAVIYFLLVTGLYLFNKYRERTKNGKKIRELLSQEKEVVKFYGLNLNSKKVIELIIVILFIVFFLMLFFNVQEMTGVLLLVKIGIAFFVIPAFFNVLASCMIYRHSDKKYIGYILGRKE